MERQTRKMKKEGDTCRDCWTERFRKDICTQWRQEQPTAQALRPSEFLQRELEEREEIIKRMRDEFGNIYDEIAAIKHLAGDIYMGRYDKEEKED